MTFYFKKGFKDELFGRYPDHTTPARAINEFAGGVIVKAHGVGIFAYIKIIDHAAWDRQVAPHVTTTKDHFFLLTLPETVNES